MDIVHINWDEINNMKVKTDMGDTNGYSSDVSFECVTELKKEGETSYEQGISK